MRGYEEGSTMITGSEEARPTLARCGALLATRVGIAGADPWDHWQMTKHMPDLVAGPGLLGASLYDVRPIVARGTSGAPNRSAIYFAEDLSGLRAWLASDELREAIEDGTQWKPLVQPLDGDWFTGNVLVADGASDRSGPELADARRLLLARWEEPGRGGSGPDVLERAATSSVVLGGLALHAIRDERVPSVYHSVGRYVLLLAIAEDATEADLRALAGAIDPDVDRARDRDGDPAAPPGPSYFAAEDLALRIYLPATRSEAAR
jgi:hypothetical protein